MAGEHTSGDQGDAAYWKEVARKFEQALAEERGRREAAERVADHLNVSDFLEQCHKLYQQLRPIADGGTRGDLTNPLDRLYPRRITPWNDFPRLQAAIWNAFVPDTPFWNNKSYNRISFFEDIHDMIKVISSEEELRSNLSFTVERMVESMLEKVTGECSLADELKIDGTISFENAASFRQGEVKNPKPSMGGTAKNSDKTHPRNARADQFCVLRSSGSDRPVALIAIECKAPHKFTVEEIFAGASSEILPKSDVIDKHGKTDEYSCKRKFAMVVTQLFSYMIDQEVRYGYICTGEVFVFGCIPDDDPTTFLYHVSHPGKDCEAREGAWTQHTAVAQVFAFVLQAASAKSRTPGLRDRAQLLLKRWPQERDESSSSPKTESEDSKDPDYKTKTQTLPELGSGPVTRSKSRETNIETAGKGGPDGEDDCGGGSLCAGALQRSRHTDVQGGTPCGRSTNPDGQGDSSRNTKTKISIWNSEFCSHKCLKGMCDGLPIDPDCPNASDHPREHISRAMFLGLLRQQVCGEDACPMGVHGARGALLKIRIASHGYNFVAKGMVDSDSRFLRREERVYNQLRPIQGEQVPVCCGLVRLDKVFYYDGEELTHLLPMSWAGISLASMIRYEKEQQLAYTLLLRKGELDAALRAFDVDHRDLEARNITYDRRSEKLMVIDFDRSVVGGHHHRSRKRRLGST